MLHNCGLLTLVRSAAPGTSCPDTALSEAGVVESALDSGINSWEGQHGLHSSADALVAAMTLEIVPATCCTPAGVVSCR